MTQEEFAIDKFKLTIVNIMNRNFKGFTGKNLFLAFQKTHKNVKSSFIIDEKKQK